MFLAGAAIAAVLACSIAGYRSGSGIGPSVRALAATTVGQSNPAQRTILYWKDPDGKNDFSTEPKKTPDGQFRVAAGLDLFRDGLELVIARRRESL